MNKTRTAAAVLGVTALAAVAAWTGASAAVAAPSASPPATAAQVVSLPPLPAHTVAASIVDAHGHSFRLNCVNWFGEEQFNMIPDGLDQTPIATITSEISSLGYNCVRLPWTNQTWEANPVIGTQLTSQVPDPEASSFKFNLSMSGLQANNPQFVGEHVDTIFEQVALDLSAAGIMSILVNGQTNAADCCQATDPDASWYAPGYPSVPYATQNAWINDWKSVTAAFDSIPGVVGVDLRNEPRGSSVTWGPSGSYDWHAAAVLGGDAVQSVDPHMLIIVEGVNFATDLSAVTSLPVTLTDPGQVVYEVHDYGFDFTSITGYDDLMSKISSQWGSLYGKVPLWLGEFGCDTSPGTSETSCSDGNGNLGPWFGPLVRYLYYHNTAWAYWALNPGAYGVLTSTWTGVADQDLQNALATIQGRCPASPIPNGTYYIKNVATGQVIDIPHSSTVQGTLLDQWPRNGGKNQQWTVDNLGCGNDEITSVLDGQSIDIKNGSTSSGGSVQEYGYAGRGNQQFVVHDDGSGDGACTISAINSMTGITNPFPIEVPGASTTDGTLLDQAAPTGATSQDWTFTDVSTGSTVTC
jgi:hypothetical protein